MPCAAEPSDSSSLPVSLQTPSTSGATPGLDWLYETQMFGVKLGLQNVRRLLSDALAMPTHGTKVLHVAGTNGKGSICAMADSVARACGTRTGLFTSPHLVTFSERIRVDGIPIPMPRLEEEISYLRTLVSGYDPHPTFFELSLALALRYFKDCRCELIILETGMGGRLDATNAVPSDVSVLAPIGMDHCEWLGDTLEKIAAEKAGIFKPGVPVFSARQEPAARRVIEIHASDTRCPLVFVEEPLVGYPVALPGRHQRHNAALAVEALFALGLPIRIDSLHHGLSSVHWPGRFDRRPEQRLVLDGAHNPAGACVLLETWRDWMPNQQACLVFSTLQDKDPTQILRILRPICERVVLCPVASPRALGVAQLAECAQEAGFAPEHILQCSNLSDALGLAQSFRETTLVAGSLYLIGEAIAFLDGLKHQPSAQ